MESPPGPRLLQQAEKVLLHPVRPHLIAYCPTMDLIALVTEEENLDVYRINGQRAFGLKRKSATTTVDVICWEFNGQAIAVAWSDGCTDILSAETGKVIHPNIPAPSVGVGSPRIQCIGWGLNFIDVDAVKRRTGAPKQKTKNGITATVAFSEEMTDDWDSFKDATTIEDFLQRQPDLEALDVAPDLPDQLAMMDLETLLPKLPAIPLPPATPFMRPMASADTAAFSTQAQVDSLLHSQQLKEHNSVDMFIRCTSEGTVHPSVYDSLETVNVELPAAWSLKSSRPILHASHPYSCSHGLLTEVKTATETKLAFVPLTLGFIPSAGIYLHLIASKTSQLQNLLLYVQQCVQRIRTYWKHSRDLPGKFMMNISETLEEKGQGDLVQNLYHLACTGNCPPLIKEWLVDELQESGHKRWDTTVTTSLSTVIQLLHENLLPALDRCSVVITRLRGLAKFHEPGWIFNTPVSDFTALLEMIENLRLLGHTALLYANDEKRFFQFFSKWLRYEIDFEATEPGGQNRAEMEARDPGVDISIVLDYIQYGLTKSDLEVFMKQEDQLDNAQREAAPTSNAETVKAIDLAKDFANYKTEAMCFDHVLRHFRQGCTKLFQQISQWQAQNITMDCGIALEGGGTTEDDEAFRALDMRMVYEVSYQLDCSALLSVVSSFAELFPTRLRGRDGGEASTATASGTAALGLRDFGGRMDQLTLEEPNAALQTQTGVQSTASNTQQSPTQTEGQLRPETTDAISTYIVLAPSSNPQNLHVHRLVHTPMISSPLSSSVHSYTATTVTFSPGSTVLDAKFADDATLLVLLQSSSSPSSSKKAKQAQDSQSSTCRILSVPYPPSASSSDNPTTIPYHTTPQLTTLPSLPSSPAIPISTRPTHAFSSTDVDERTRHVFDERFTPLKMMINGRRGRRVVLVLGSDRKHYRVLDLDYGVGEGGD